MSSKKEAIIIWSIVGVATLLLIGVILSTVLNKPTEVHLPFDEFVAKLSSGEITNLYIDGYDWIGYSVVDGKTVATYTTVGPSMYDYASFQAFIQDLGGHVNFSVTFGSPKAGEVIWSKLASIFNK